MERLSLCRARGRPPNPRLSFCRHFSLVVFLNTIFFKCLHIGFISFSFTSDWLFSQRFGSFDFPFAFDGYFQNILLTLLIQLNLFSIRQLNYILLNIIICNKMTPYMVKDFDSNIIWCWFVTLFTTDSIDVLHICINIFSCQVKDCTYILTVRN